MTGAAEDAVENEDPGLFDTLTRKIYTLSIVLYVPEYIRAGLLFKEKEASRIDGSSSKRLS